MHVRDTFQTLAQNRFASDLHATIVDNGKPRLAAGFGNHLPVLPVKQSRIDQLRIAPYEIEDICLCSCAVFHRSSAANFVTVHWRSNPTAHLLGSAMLASPFAVLAIAHFAVANGWRSHAFLLSGNLLLTFFVLVASFLMRWFQPGWAGIAFFSLLLLCIGAILAVGGLVFRDKQNQSSLKVD